MKKYILMLFPLFCFSLAFSLENSFLDFYEKAQSCEEISCIREEINRINLEILKLMTERTAYVKRAGDLKYAKRQNASDLARIKDQEIILINQAHQMGLPIEIMLPTFRVLVKESVQFQQRYIQELEEAHLVNR